jgi:RimJ/RimL family protein N-acetyltransferase
MDVAKLWSIRVRTPRLELRLPTDEELEKLYRLAEAGIHPPDEMPFAVPWTDNLNEEDFLSFHRGSWNGWTPEKWTCNLVTFRDGEVIGTQGFEGVNFAETREVETGSWLGAAFQGHGYGTEQRIAVLELAFRGLNAVAARSGALVHNVASQRISEKLGYRMTGTSEIAPRGEPVPHFNYRIEREEWRCPVPVEIAGFEPALPLFGAPPKA